MSTLVAPLERPDDALESRRREARFGTSGAPRAASPKARSVRKLGRRPVLDGIRGTAVVLVMLEHCGVLKNGFMGVDVFFALSGFLITTLLIEEWERRSQVSLKGFYARRARRLLPALLLVVGAAVIVNVTVYPLTGWPILKKAAIALLFVNNWSAGLGHASQMGALNITWSLGEEEQFYLLWPILLIFLLRRQVRPWTMIALLTATIVGLLILEPYVYGAVAGYSHYYSPIDRATELLFGCCGALVWHYRLIRLPKGWVAGVCAAVLVAAFAYLATSTNGSTNERLSYLSACGLALPALILLIESPNSPLGRLFSSRPLRHMGRISYCVYLCHLLVRNLVQHFIPHQSVYFNFSATLIISVLLATLSWHFLESRVIAWRPQRRRIRIAPLRAQTPIRSSA